MYINKFPVSGPSPFFANPTSEALTLGYSTHNDTAYISLSSQDAYTFILPPHTGIRAMVNCGLIDEVHYEVEDSIQPLGNFEYAPV